MKLGSLISIKVGSRNADFYVIRRGSHSKVGLPVREFSKEAFSVDVIRKEVIDPNYLFYLLTYLWSKGYFSSVASGTTALVNIRKEDIEDIRLRR